MNPRVRFDDEADAEYRLPVDGTRLGESTWASSSSMPLTPPLIRSWRRLVRVAWSGDCQLT